MGATDVTFDGSDLWVTNTAEGTITRIKRTGESPELSSFPVCKSPLGILYYGSSLWITDQDGDEVVRVEANTGEVVGKYVVGEGPRGMAFDGANVWVVSETEGIVSKK